MTADHPLSRRLDVIENLLLAERSANINLRNEVNDQRLSRKFFDESLLEYIKANSTAINAGQPTILRDSSSILTLPGLNNKDIRIQVDREEDLLSRERVRQLTSQLQAATKRIEKVESDNATLLTRMQEMELRLQSADLQQDFDAVFKYRGKRIHEGLLGSEGLAEVEKTLNLRRQYFGKELKPKEWGTSGPDQKETAQDGQQQITESTASINAALRAEIENLRHVLRSSPTPVNVSDVVALPASTAKADHGVTESMELLEDNEKAMLAVISTAEKTAIKAIDEREKAALKTITDLDENAMEAVTDLHEALTDLKSFTDGEKAALASVDRNEHSPLIKSIDEIEQNRQDAIAVVNQQKNNALAAIASREKTSLHTIDTAKEELLKHAKAISTQFSNTQGTIAQSLNTLNKTRDDAIASIKKLQVDVGKGGGKEREKQLNAVGYKWQSIIEKLGNKTQQATSDAKRQALAAIQQARDEMDLYVVAHKAEMVESIEITGVNESDKLKKLADEIMRRVAPCRCGVCQKQKKNIGISEKKGAIAIAKNKNQHSAVSDYTRDNEEISEDSEDYEDEAHGDVKDDEREKLWKDEWPKYWEGAGPEGLGRERDERDVN